MKQRVILLILDGLGVGELPDAKAYGDSGSNTLKHVWCKNPNINIPNLAACGLLRLIGKNHNQKITASYGKSAVKSKGKDSTTGHWEIAGVILKKAFPLYPGGFPSSVINKFEKIVGRKSIWNLPASGSEIIKKLGSRHVKTGELIVYTSADSVFQIAAHEKVVPVNELYRYCEAARKILKGRHAVGRVIARPFLGTEGSYYRTKNRKDYSLPPVSTTILDKLVQKGVLVDAVGKIGDLFSCRGISRIFKTTSNIDGIKKTVELIRSKRNKHFVITNLIDFDMVYGHRNDYSGYARALQELDRKLPLILKSMEENDTLIITSDHGCDPVMPSTDHSREYVPVLVCGRKVRKNCSIGVRDTLADISAFIADVYRIKNWRSGKSFYKDIII